MKTLDSGLRRNDDFGINQRFPRPVFDYPMAMRLSPDQIAIIKRTAAKLFGAEARDRLFGSRVDDSQKGGDIDLLVELPCSQPEARRKSLTLVARLQQQLGDQPIDVLVAAPDTPDQPILRVARQCGVPL